MKTHFASEKEIFYDGSQLKSLFGYLNHGILGDSIVGWIGGCEIPQAHMVDGEDLRAGCEIRGKKMLHFIVEKFGIDLFGAVALQRLMASLAISVLGEAVQQLSAKNVSDECKKIAAHLWRDGDDVFYNDQKLSISIATVSPVSALIHFAVNITNEGTPVPTLSLADLDVSPALFAENFMSRVAIECESIQIATQKVRPVGSF